MITTRSKFWYGMLIDDENYVIDFNEGAASIRAEITLGGYSHTTILDAIETAMNAVGGQTYTASINRTTRKITISAPGNFELEGATGSGIGTGTLSLLGFNTDTGLSTSHTGDSEAGYEWKPQFWLQGYAASKDNTRKANSKTNKSGSGTVEVVSFGTESFMECNATLITDNFMVPNAPIENNSTAVADANSFLTFCIEKSPVEFMEDRSAPAVFETFLLESTPASSSGVGYRLTEMISRNLAGYYETGRLVFRKL